MNTSYDANQKAGGKIQHQLSPVIQKRLGELLALTYDQNPSESCEASSMLTNSLQRLVTALSVQADFDEKSFHADFIALIPNLRRFALSLTKNAAHADDLVQDTMLKAWRSRSSYIIGTNLIAWLFTIMRNNFYTLARKQSKEEFIDRDNENTAIAILPTQLARLDLEDMQTALGKLPNKMRQALILVTIDNKTYDEAADIMQCRVGTVKSRVWRGREQLISILGYKSVDLGADCVTMAAMHSSSSPNY